jgi:hypothetical protein
MVVVEHANKSIGQTIEIEFIRSLQTAAGKMMFAKPVERQQQPVKVQKPTGKRPVVQPAPEQPVIAVQQQAKAVYHSDAKERGYEKKNSARQPRANDKPRPVRSNKPRTSVQREAALIDLVEKQQ